MSDDNTFDRSTLSEPNRVRHALAKTYRGLKRRFDENSQSICDHIKGRLIQLAGLWPCSKAQVLVVGCESSGTTVISRMLHGGCNGRFLLEGRQRWVWRAYMSVFQAATVVEDYPRLQLFDFVKVPGFASILPQYKAAFPNAQIVYVVRDPRDVLASAIRTFRVADRQSLGEINWIKQDWLGLQTADPVERLARRWRTYLVTSEQIDNVVYVKYEDFCLDKIGTTRRLCRELSLSFNEEIAGAISTQQASHVSARNYEPMGPGSWKQCPVVQSVSPHAITSVCGEQMTKWGYDF